MPSSISALPDSIDDLRKWFPYDRKDQVPEKTFELGLVLGGTVSAGAYTAGALDFLIEALDCWHEAKRKNLPGVPAHDVKLRIITGASGGGMCGAIFAAACRHRFPPVRPETGNEWRLNPFYSTWVRDVDIRPMLDVSDIREAEPMRSLLNCGGIEAIADSVAAFPENHMNSGTAGIELAPPDVRGWLDDSLRLALTVTNIRGMPYSLAFPGATGVAHEMRLHADFMEFDLPTPHTRSAIDSPPHVQSLSAAAQTGELRQGKARQLFRDSALATGSFPLVLQPRSLEKPSHSYRYRFLTWTDENMTEYVFGNPSPRGGIDAPYRFLTVDGGALNNEPFELARRYLSGSHGHNPRAGADANRAIILIDPLNERQQTPGEPEPGEELQGLLRLISPTLSALTGQARFRADEIGLMQNPDVYSRYMIAPKRGPIVSDQAIVNSRFRAFLGFFSEDYRYHDFMLGRRNAQGFLRNFFGLPPGNDAIDHRDMKLKGAGRTDHSPIIPLYGTAAEEIPEPDWPRGKLESGQPFRAPIKKRILWIARKIRKDRLRSSRNMRAGLASFRNRLGRFLTWQYLGFGWRLGGCDRLVDTIIGELDKEVKKVNTE